MLQNTQSFPSRSFQRDIHHTEVIQQTHGGLRLNAEPQDSVDSHSSRLSLIEYHGLVFHLTFKTLVIYLLSSS